MKKKHRGFAIRLSALTVISITVAASAAVSICILLFSSVYSRSLLRDAKVNSEQAVQQACVAVNNYLDGMKDKIVRISDEVAECESVSEFNEKISAVTRIQSDIYSVMVYNETGRIISCSSSSGLVLKESIYKNLSFDSRLFSETQDFAVTKPHVQTLFEGEYPWVVTIAAREDTPLFGNGVYIAIDFRFSEIAKYIDNVGVGRHGYCYVTDSAGSIIYHPQQQMLYSGLKSEPEQRISQMSDGVHSENDVIYTLNTTEDGRWRIVGVSYTSELTVERREQILNAIIISFVCCAAIALLVLLLFSKIVNAPVRRLIRAMKAFESNADTFVYKGGYESVTELKALSDSFAHMSKRIKRLMDRVRHEETALRKTELKALQAQINPHFLYNTLDSIQWMCEQGNNAEAVRMVGALAKLFRISISRGHELITIKDEMQHAQSYLIIQSFRYRNQFSYEFRVDEALEKYLCNKITVQPLIENAIYHGIDRMVDEGRITVTVRSAGDGTDDILIEVEDNGVGMTQEQCTRILKKERSDSSGIGVKNVNDRLKIYFGDKYGITVKSELDAGTLVTVRIPKIEKEPENEA